MLLLRSYHTNDEYKYNENNLGLLVRQHVTPNLSLEGGSYFNSIKTRSDIGGASIEANPINLSHNGNLQLYLGITVGFALYNKTRDHVPFKKTRTYALPEDGKIPQNYKFRSGYHAFERQDRYDTACRCVKQEYVETVTGTRVVGTGKRVPQFSVFPTARLTFNDNGLFLIGAYGPGLGQGKKWGGVFATGVTLNPYRWYNPRPQP